MKKILKRTTLALSVLLGTWLSSSAYACDTHDHLCTYHALGVPRPTYNVNNDETRLVIYAKATDTSHGNAQTDFDNHVLLPTSSTSHDWLGTVTPVDVRPFINSRTSYGAANPSDVGEWETSDTKGAHVYGSQYQVIFNKNTAQAIHTGDLNGGEKGNTPYQQGCPAYEGKPNCEAVVITGNVPSGTYQQQVQMFNFFNKDNPSAVLTVGAWATGHGVLVSDTHLDSNTQSMIVNNGRLNDSISQGTTEQTHYAFLEGSKSKLAQPINYKFYNRGFDPHASGVVTWDHNKKYHTRYGNQFNHLNQTTGNIDVLQNKYTKTSFQRTTVGADGSANTNTHWTPERKTTQKIGTQYCANGFASVRCDASGAMIAIDIHGNFTADYLAYEKIQHQKYEEEVKRREEARQKHEEQKRLLAEQQAMLQQQNNQNRNFFEQLGHDATIFVGGIAGGLYGIGEGVVGIIDNGIDLAQQGVNAVGYTWNNPQQAWNNTIQFGQNIADGVNYAINNKQEVFNNLTNYSQTVLDELVNQAMNQKPINNFSDAFQAGKGHGKFIAEMVDPSRKIQLVGKSGELLGNLAKVSPDTNPAPIIFNNTNQLTNNRIVPINPPKENTPILSFPPKETNGQFDFANSVLIGKNGTNKKNHQVSGKNEIETNTSLIKPSLPIDNRTRDEKYVDFAKSQIKGSEESKLVNDLKPDTDYTLSNGTKFSTNEHGYVTELSFKPDFDNKGTRDSRQTYVGTLGIEGDVGGHIQACAFGGTCDRYNLFPQNGNFNNSAYKSFENAIRKAHNSNKTVENVTVKFIRQDPNNPRPDALEVSVTIDGKTIIENFRNEHGGGK